MCWILWYYKEKNPRIPLELFSEWLGNIKHRGPDNFWIFQNEEIILWHALLTIQSDSITWKQPFIYGNTVISFNGEIFNKSYLESILMDYWVWIQTKTDTEIVAKILDVFWKDWFSYFDWFFSIAYYNKSNWDFLIARDVHGIKPLYYTKTIEEEFIFCSEIKGILPMLKKKVDFNYNTLIKAIYFQLWMDLEETYFDWIFSLAPWMIFNIKTWEKIFYVPRTNLDISKLGNNEIIELIEKELNFSIKKNIDSLYPVACLLSWWIDSTIITKVFSQSNQWKVDAYTTVYNSWDNQDLLFAEKLVKQQNNIQHTKILVSENDFNLKNLRDVTFHMEEIMLDKVYISMWINFKKISNDWYRVVLSWQGSDELWAWYYNTWNIYKLYEDNDILSIDKIVNFYTESSVFNETILSNVVKDLSRGLISEHIFKYIWKPNININDWINCVSHFSKKTILHNLLLQEDKLSMAFGIECRVPFLDTQSIWFIAKNTSWKFKILDQREKYPIRMIAKKIIWQEFSDRKKYPFPESPTSYNQFYKKLLEENFEKISKSKILWNVLDTNQFHERNFSDKEVWWIISIWQFEESFTSYLNF